MSALGPAEEGKELGRRLSLAAVAAGLFLLAALGGCRTTADSASTVGLHGTPEAAQESSAALAQPAAAVLGASNEPSEALANAAATEPQSYYVEFRARAGPVFHTYMVYGPLDSAGRPLEENFVGFHPKGGLFGLVAGSAPIPVPGQLDKVWSDEHLPVLARYRAQIGPAQYRNMVAFVEQERKKEKYWNLWVYNCNSFAAEMANAAGLKAPHFPAVFPPVYVAVVAAMNGGGPMPSEATLAAARWTPSTRNERRWSED